MQTVTLSEAQARLPELIAGLHSGEELLVLAEQRPIARIVPVPDAANDSEHRPTFGSAKGLITERHDCWEPDTDVWKDYLP